jgi:CRP-like cAMP-binding protein
MVTSVRRINYRVKELGEGSLVGMEEFILSDVPRCVQALAVTDCELAYIDQEEFFECKYMIEIKIFFNSVR